MNKKPQTQQKYINAINELWSQNHFKVFHYSKSKLIYEKFSVTVAMNTILVKVGLLEPCSKGYYKFTRQPSNQDCINAYNTNLQNIKAYNAAKKQKVKELPPPPRRIESYHQSTKSFALLTSRSVDIRL
jgi:hypothetical protein